MAKNVGRLYEDELIPQLCHIMSAATMEQSTTRLKQFCAHWASKVPLYYEYFRAMWLKRWPVDVWSAFGRYLPLQNIPTGDQILEGWHGRIQHHIWPKPLEALDHAISYLWDEWEQHRRLLSSPSLVAAHEKEKEDDAKKWRAKAAALPAHAPPATLTAASPQALSLPSSTSSTPYITSLPEESGDVDIAGGDSKSILAEPAQSPEPGVCSECKQNKANIQCILKACQKCCARSINSECRVAKHRALKESMLRRPLLAKLEELFLLPREERPPLYIQYMGGTQKGAVRPVTPTRWAAHPTSFFATSGTTEMEKKYLISRVAEWRDSFWNL